MFTSQNKVRLHDMDMAGLLYFPRQFRFVHDALEDFMAKEGFPFSKLFKGHGPLFVIVHCEADYYAPMKVGDVLNVSVHCAHIGTTSFTLHYNILREDGTELGKAKTVHVSLDKESRKKITIPQPLLKVLELHKLKDS